MRPPGSSRLSRGCYVAAGAVITSLILGVIAHTLREPFVFPSMGPTVFIAFYAPLTAQAASRNVVFGHGIGLVAGYLALVVFGLTHAAPDVFDISPARVGAVTIALTLTLALMVWLDVLHAPAAATTMIVALGLIRAPTHLGIMMVAVVVVVAVAFAINRLAGIDVPVWSPSRP